MDEDDLDDLNSEQKAELEGHLYSLIHHSSSEKFKPVGCESVLPTNPFNSIIGPADKNNLSADNISEIEDKESSKYATLPKAKCETTCEESDSDVICLSDSDDNDDVIVIKPPTPELICIESDEYDSDDSAVHSNSMLHVRMKKQKSSPIEESTKTTFAVPKTQTIQNSLHNGNSSFIEKLNNRSCSSPTSVASDDFIRNDCDNLNISDQNVFQFNIHHPELDVSTSTQVSAYVAASDTSSDCTEISTNHEILVHSEDICLSNIIVGKRNNENQTRINNSTENPEFSSKNTSIDQANNKHKNTHTKKSHDKSLSKSKSRDATFNSDTNLEDGSQMEDFYSKSWGGETFDHNSIILSMSRDRSQWKISNSDKRRCRRPPGWRPIRCNNCNHMGHPAMNCTEPKHVIKCYMCGMAGHAEPRCPNKICLKCGSTTTSFIVGCNSCRSSISNICQLCGMPGHHKNNCPDLWRRYHKTTDTSESPVADHEQSLKSPQNLFCSNCSSRGHLYHHCRELRPNQHGLILPNVVDYTAVYPLEPNRNTPAIVENDKNVQTKQKDNKRKSDGVRAAPKQCKYNENDFLNSLNDIESLASDDSFDISRSTMIDFVEDASGNFECLDQSHLDKSFPGNMKENCSMSVNPDTKPITQDNCVTSSDSEILSNTLMTSKETFAMLMKHEGAEFLKGISQMVNFTVQLKFSADGGSLLLTGTKAQQQIFQQKLKDWTRQMNQQLISAPSPSSLPRKAADLLIYLKTQIASISKSFGSPLVIYNYLKNVVIGDRAIVNTRQIKLYNRHMKKLNMCLIGKLGYGGGKLHMEKLKEKMIELEKLPKPDSVVPPPLYRDIKLHYDYMFTSFDHGNYEELLEKFKEDRTAASKIQSNELCKTNDAPQGECGQISFSRNLNNGDEFLMDTDKIPQMHPQTSTPNRIPKQQFQDFVKCQMIEHYNECLRYASGIIDQARCSKTLKKQLRSKLRPFLSRSKTGKVMRKHVIALEAVVRSLKKVKFVTSKNDNV